MKIIFRCLKNLLKNSAFCCRNTFIACFYKEVLGRVKPFSQCLKCEFRKRKLLKNHNDSFSTRSLAKNYF